MRPPSPLLPFCPGLPAEEIAGEVGSQNPPGHGLLGGGQGAFWGEKDVPRGNLGYVAYLMGNLTVAQ